jgi:hypothetical protein
MKNQMFTTVLAILFAISAIIIADYVILAAIGLIANVFSASVFFYEKVYPYLMAIIISASIAYPLTAILFKKNNNIMANVHSLFSHKHHTGNYKKTA